MAVAFFAVAFFAVPFLPVAFFDAALVVGAFVVVTFFDTSPVERASMSTGASWSWMCASPLCSDSKSWCG